MTRTLVVVSVLALLACGKKKDQPTTAEPTGSSGSAIMAPPADAVEAVAGDAAEAPDAAQAAAPKLGDPVTLDSAFTGLSVRSFDEWTPTQKKDDVSFENKCCMHKIHLRPVHAKLRSIDDLKVEIGTVKQFLTKSVDEVVEKHDVDRGWWAVVKGPSMTFEGDINTVALRVVHLKGTTFVCSTLTATGAAGRDVRPDEVVAACETLAPK